MARSKARFRLLSNDAVQGLVLAAQPERVTEGFLFFQRTYEVDRFEEFLDSETRACAGEETSPLVASGFVLSSVQLVLAETHGVDLEGLQHRELAASLEGPGRLVLVFARRHARAVLERWPEDSPSVTDIWAVLRDHGFAETQRGYADELATAMATLRGWLEAVDWDHTGVLWTSEA